MVQHFEWDDQKAENNFRKHGVLFEEATFVFNDPFAVWIQDRVEDGEERWQVIGMSGDYLLLMVAHTLCDASDEDETIRIISARRATPKERRDYEHSKI